MTTTQQLRLIIAALLLALAVTFFYYNSQDVVITADNSVCMDYDKYNPSTLKTGLVGDMVSIYRENQLEAIKSSSGMAMDDAYSIWFDLDSIKKFIYHIEKGVEKNGDNTKTNKLGLRMYYASYPDKSTWKAGKYDDLSAFDGDATKQDYEFKHTIVILPTIHVGGNELDFNPFNAATYTTGLPKYTKPKNENQEPGDIDTSAASKVDVIAITGSKDAADPIDRTTAKNHGALYPPGTPPGLSFE